MSAILIVLAPGEGVNYSRFSILDFSVEWGVLNCYRTVGWIGSPVSRYRIKLSVIDTTHPLSNSPQ